MGSHLIDGQFQSDKYPTTPRGFVPLKTTDRDAQPVLWAYAQVHRARDQEFSADLETALRNAGFVPPVTKKVADMIANREEPPLPLSVIPNYMGINLCSVDSVSWTERADGQLVDLTIRFTPADDQGPNPSRPVAPRREAMDQDDTHVCEQCGQSVAVRADRSGIVAHRCPHGIECILEPGDPRVGKSDWACKECMPASICVEMPGTQLIVKESDVRASSLRSAVDRLLGQLGDKRVSIAITGGE